MKFVGLPRTRVRSDAFESDSSLSYETRTRNDIARLLNYRLQGNLGDYFLPAAYKSLFRGSCRQVKKVQKITYNLKK